MILPDVNVLIYAFRTDNDHHAVCRAWLEAVVSGDARFGISPPALSAVVRITTDRRIFTKPSPAEEAFRFCDTLLGQPHCQIVEPGERHWELFRRLCLETNTRARGSPTPGSPRLRSNGAASGSRWTATMHGSRA